MRSKIHYFFYFIVLSLYGGQVCPFIDSLSMIYWVLELGLIITLTYVIRTLRIKHIHRKVPYHSQVSRQLVEEMGLFMSAGILTALYNYLILDFPMESGVKAFTGFAIFSFFIAVDESLERERSIAEHIRVSQEEVFVSGAFMPLTRKFAIVAAICSFSVFIVLFLIFSKDLDWLIQTHPDEIDKAKASILFEIGFVILVLLAHLFNLILSFSKNLNLFIENENIALMGVAKGNLDSYVPVSSTDEFGIMASYTNQMILSLRDRTQELLHTQDVTIFCLASLAETRDPETGGHIMRTQRYIRLLAEYMKNNSGNSIVLTDSDIELLFKSAPLHDIGKVGIPDHILLKPGKLSDEEFEIMKKHSTHGRNAIQKAEEILGAHSFLTYAREIAYSHHEKWNGTGYPEGLKGDEIPFSARLMALVDVYDALISKRVYKPPSPHQKAVSIIGKGKGSHFDPDMVDAFLVLEDQFRQIAVGYADFQEERRNLAR